MDNINLIDLIKRTALKVILPLMPTFRLGTVENGYIRLDGEDEPLAGIPKSFMPLNDGDRVEVRFTGTEAFVTNRTGGSLPVGVVLPTAAPNAPEGWLVCNGAAFDASAYPKLYELLGSNILPNLQGRTIVGVDGNDPEMSLYATGGEKTHTLSVAEMPSHSHTPNDNGSFLRDGTGTNNASAKGSQGYKLTSRTDTTGGGGAHNNMQPYMALTYIIKAR